MADLFIQMSGDEARVVNALKKIIDKEAELARKAIETGEASARATDKASDALGRMAAKFPAITTGLGRAAEATSAFTKDVVGGIAGATSAADALLQVLGKISEERTRALSDQRASLANQRLSQLAGGDAARLQEMNANAAAIFGAGGAPSMDRAKQIEFGLQSGGFTSAQDRGLVAALGAHGVVEDPARLVAAATIFRQSFGEKAGSLEQILSRAQVAAGPSVADLEPLLTSTGKAAASAGHMGVDPNEFLSVLGVLSRTTPNAETASTQMSSFVGLMEGNPELQGKGLAGAVQAITAKGLDPTALRQFLPDIEGRRAYFSLAGNLGMVGQQAAAQEMAAQGGAGSITGTIRSLMADPQVAQDVALRQQEARLQLERMPIAAEEAAQERVRQRLEREQIEAGTPAPVRAGRALIREGFKKAGLGWTTFEDHATSEERADRDAAVLGALQLIEKNTRGGRLTIPGEGEGR